MIERWTEVRSEPAAAPDPGIVDAADSAPAGPHTLPVVQAVPEESGPPLNTATLDTLRSLGTDGGWEIARRVAEAYLKDTPGRLESLRAAVAAGDAQAMRKAAHALKSGSGNIGAERLTEICKIFETLGRRESLEGAHVLLARAEREYQRIQEALAAYLAGAETSTEPV